MFGCQRHTLAYIIGQGVNRAFLVAWIFTFHFKELGSPLKWAGGCVYLCVFVWNKFVNEIVITK